MATSNPVLAFVFSLLVCAAFGKPYYSESQQFQARQCRLQRLTRSHPSQRIESEGGLTELWDENEEQFQCAGAAAMRVTIRSNSLALPKYLPAPRLVYIQRGRGLLGISFPGCAETYQSSERGQGMRDQHQKVHRIRRGDIIAIPAGAAHWCYNDGNEDLVEISVTDLSNPNNQLDQNFRAFMLAGGQQMRGMMGEQTRETFGNIFQGFDERLMAEALNVPVETVRRMQERSNRGLIVRCREEMRMIAPDEEEEQIQMPRNGMEETICTMKIKQNIDTQREADVYSRQAGKINVVNQHKLPILRHIDMSAEKGFLQPNAMHTPHWSMSDNRVVYVVRGEAQVQITDDFGRRIMNERVREGDMFVIPQFYATMARAGSSGMEWVSVKTCSEPMKSPMAGKTSVMRAMPLHVIVTSYQMSPRESQDLKMSRAEESLVLSPGRRSD